MSLCLLPSRTPGVQTLTCCCVRYQDSKDSSRTCRGSALLLSPPDCHLWKWVNVLAQKISGISTYRGALFPKVKPIGWSYFSSVSSIQSPFRQSEFRKNLRAKGTRDNVSQNKDIRREEVVKEPQQRVLSIFLEAIKGLVLPILCDDRPNHGMTSTENKCEHRLPVVAWPHHLPVLLPVVPQPAHFLWRQWQKRLKIFVL